MKSLRFSINGARVHQSLRNHQHTQNTDVRFDAAEADGDLQIARRLGRKEALHEVWVERVGEEEDARGDPVHPAQRKTPATAHHHSA